MDNTEEKILIINKSISKNISRFDDSERGLLSQNILSQLRNLVEHIFLKIYNHRKNTTLEPQYDNFIIAKHYIKSIGKLRFLGKFHDLLQISVSHYTLDENASERLMLKYYEYLLKIKNFLLEEYDLKILLNINDFPIKLDKATQEYYKKIAEKLNMPPYEKNSKNRYYIQKIKPFFINNKVYYEVTFTKSHEKISKFDRIIAFTKLDIIQNYAVNLNIEKAYIDILGKKMPINIIQNWEVSIRPCELNNFAKIFSIYMNIQSGNKEYRELMKFLTLTGFDLSEYVIQKTQYYEFVKDKITQGGKVQFFYVLDKCRELFKKNSPGANIIRYLLYIMNNKIIKEQTNYETNSMLSNLCLKWGCIPFDQMPFTSSLINHNPRIYDLFDCISIGDKEHEFLARLVQNNTELKGEIFTEIDKIGELDKVKMLMNKYNSRIYKKKHSNRIMNFYKNDYLYMQGYKDDTIAIIERLKELSQNGVENYTNFVINWLENSELTIDCEDKKNFLIKMFKETKVAIIYGAAGTGKSTIINYISHIFSDKQKIYLTQTNPAIDNLKRKIDTSNCEFMTIAKFLSKKTTHTKYTILFIDESSTVSNSNMLSILNKASFSLLVLVGDIYQIESIRFGNWFEAVKDFLPNNAIFELTKPYRSKNKELLNLWKKVRNLEDDISEHIQRNHYSTNLDESIFDNHRDDEIILCLNYDGLYGINNINRFLQTNNPSKPIEWGDLMYKINDPVLFNETKRFGDAIYNNLKGKIVYIKILDKQIEFHIEIEKVLSELDTELCEYELVSSDDNKTTIGFKVNQFPTTDEDEESTDVIVPFQVAYAVSIHKAQGLEYNSVKIVITNEVEEQITHNIFYTAITRAKESLKIYWSPETENKILNGLKRRNNKKDVGLLKSIISKKRQK